MGRKIRRVIFIIALAVLIGALGYIGYTYLGYRKDAKVYEAAAGEFVKPNGSYVPVKATSGNVSDVIKETVENAEEETALPIEVDFDALKEINPDVIGWIYCPDTVINYPVLKTTDNDTYLHHNYKNEYTASGSIFVECANRDDFADLNTIIYGHHMKDGSMFASLSKWTKQEYYDEHPVMYLFTPEQNYIVELFSAYATAAGSDSYYAIQTPCKEMDDYLERVSGKSMFECDVELPGDEKYIMLSTCAYMFENARNVLHGKLVPIE